MSELNYHRSAAAAGQNPASPRQLSQQDISRIVTAIGDMVADSERRQSEVMQDMQQRIGQIADKAGASCPEIPDKFRSELKQLEEAIAQLADRVALATSASGHKEEPARQTEQPADIEAEAGATQIVGNAALPRDPDNTSLDNFWPNNSWPNSSWDATAAEQLTQLYERGEAGLPLSAADSSTLPAAAGRTAQGLNAATSTANDDYLREQFAIIQTSLAELPGDVRKSDRMWISEEFSELAAQLEAGLNEVKQQPHSLAAIEDRFGQFEDRVCGAFDKFDNNQVAQGLKEIQASIADFTAHLEKNQTEMSRIASLGQDIRDLAKHFSDERIRAIAAELQASRQDIDPAELAEQVANDVAARSIREINELMPARQPDDRATLDALAGLRGMVGDMMTEQRNECKQTAGRLEAVHAGMLRILERVEKLEASPAGTAHAASGKPIVNRTQAASPTCKAGRQQPQHSRLAWPGHGASQGDENRQTAAKIDPPAQAGTRNGRFSIKEPQSPLQPPPRKNTPYPGLRLFDLRLAIVTITAAAIGLGAAGILLRFPSSPSPQNVTEVAPTAPDGTSRQADSTFTTPSATISPNAMTVERSATATEPAVETAPGEISPTVPRQHTQAQDIQPHDTREETGRVAEQVDKTTDLPTQAEASPPVATTIPTALVPSGQRKAVAPPPARNLPSPQIGPLSLRIAAADGDPSASFEIGVRFAEGRGVQPNFTEAIKWYSRSASKGFPLAQYRLAAIYERGMGTDVDFARAKVWYERAARKGNIKAMHNLAVLLAGSQVGATDYGAAVQWFREAAERGLMDSKFNLAILYENGLGVSKDLAKAYKWFALAARGGDKDASQRRRKLVGKLDKETLAKTDAAIRKWRPRPISQLANDPLFAGTQWKVKPVKLRHG